MYLAYVYLNNAIFSEKISEWLRTLRKYNASVIFATQSLDELIKCPIFSTILESCESRIFLPNDKIHEKSTKEIYQRFRLNERQINIIANATAKKQYYYTSSLGARLYDLALGPVALAFVSVNKADLIECERILDEYGHEGFVEKWCEYKKIDRL